MKIPILGRFKHLVPILVLVMLMTLFGSVPVRANHEFPPPAGWPVVIYQDSQQPNGYHYPSGGNPGGGGDAECRKVAEAVGDPNFSRLFGIKFESNDSPTNNGNGTWTYTFTLPNGQFFSLLGNAGSLEGVTEFDWESGLPLDYVLAKGSAAWNVYGYNEAQNDTR
jgi:hypothetical protein